MWLHDETHEFMWKFGICVSTSIENHTLLNGPPENPYTSGSIDKPMYTLGPLPGSGGDSGPANDWVVACLW